VKSNILIAIIIILIVIIASAVGVLHYMKNQEKTESQENKLTPEGYILEELGENKTVTMSLGPGSKITFRSYLETYTTYYNTTNGTQTYPQKSNLTVNITINKYDKWPFVNITNTDQENGSPQLIPYPVVEIPKENVGAQTLNLPVSIPFVNEGLCMKFTLTNTSNGTYTYTSQITIANYKVTSILVYDSQGVVISTLYRIESIKPVNNTMVNLTHKLVRLNYSSTGEYKVTVPSTWSCNPPLSSHLWFTEEGIYKLNTCKLEQTSINDLIKGMKEGSIVFYLNKGCPHCINDWPNIIDALNAVCKSASGKVYLVIIGGFMNSTVANYIQLTMTQNGITGYPALAYFKDGFVQNKTLGERSAEQIVEFIRVSLGLQS
jgi:hypothetical protein